MRDYRETAFICTAPTRMRQPEVTRGVYPPGTIYPGQQRISMRLGGQTVLIAPPARMHPMRRLLPYPHYGLEHIGLIVGLPCRCPYRRRIRYLKILQTAAEMTQERRRGGTP